MARSSEQNQLISFSYVNTNNPDVFYTDEIENAIDSLETAVFFLKRVDNLKWKWISIALHHSLYSFCIACLVNGNYENVLFGGSKDDENRFCLKGNSTKWRKLKKVKIDNSPGYIIEWDEIEGNPPKTKLKNVKNNKQKKLIGFWTALARVQDSYYWMGRRCNTKAVKLSEKEWKSISWLTNQVRNYLVHFIPTLLLVSIKDVKEACLDVLRIIEFLSFNSGLILSPDHKWRNRIKNSLDDLKNYLNN